MLQLRRPLLITESYGIAQWRGTAAGKRSLTANVLTVHDTAFARKDANSDIQSNQRQRL